MVIVLDIYGRQQRLISAENSVRVSGIPEQDKKLILDFETYLFSQNLDLLRVEKYLRVLRVSVEKLNKPISEVTTNDLTLFFAELNRSGKSGWTKQAYYLFLRRFYAWMGKPDIFKINKMPRGKSKIPILLSKSDIETTIKRSSHPRDKAMIYGFYDAGCRVGEWFENLKLGDFIFEDNIHEELIKVGDNLYEKKRIKSQVCIVNLFGKTGARSVRLNGSSEYIKDWINMHPNKDNLKSYVWCDDKGLPLFSSYDEIKDHVLTLLQKAGITKKIRLGAFRHSAMTKRDDEIRKTMLKTEYGTQQYDTYIHSNAKI